MAGRRSRVKPRRGEGDRLNFAGLSVVIQVGVMRMTVPVRMPLRHRRVVADPVVPVMDVTVLVLERVVFVFVTTNPFHTGA